MKIKGKAFQKINKISVRLTLSMEIPCLVCISVSSGLTPGPHSEVLCNYRVFV